MTVSGKLTSSGYRPKVGRNHASPHMLAGTLMDPSVSSAIASGAIRAATAAAEPPLLPPGTCSGSYGFRTGPKVALLLVHPYESSCRLVLPIRMAPWANRGFNTAASSFALKSRNARVPFDVGR